MGAVTKTPLRHRGVFFAIALCLWALSLWQTARNVQMEPGGDLRNRVATARRLAAGIDPYLTPDIPLPEYYRSFTPSTASPTHFLLYVPLSKLDYRTQRWAYFVIDWLIVIAVFLVLRRMIPKGISTELLLFLYSLILLSDASFLLHFARGQIYLQLLLFTAAAALEMSRGGERWWPAAVLGFLLWLRPTYAVIPVALAIQARWKDVRRIVVASALLGLVVVSLAGVVAWRDYLAMLNRSQSEHLEIITGTYPIRASSPVIENDDYRRFQSFHGWEADRTFLGLFNYGRFGQIATRRGGTLLAINNILLLLVVPLLLLAVQRARLPATGLHQAGLLLMLPVIIETFGPHRMAYSDVLLTVPLLIAAATLCESRPDCVRWVLVFAVLYTAVSRFLVGGSVALWSQGRFLATILILTLYFLSGSRQEPSPFRSRQRQDFSPS